MTGFEGDPALTCRLPHEIECDAEASVETVCRCHAFFADLATSFLRRAGLLRTVDPEDIVQGMWLVFFAGLRDERFQVSDIGSVMRLGSAIIRLQVAKSLEHYTAACRDFHRVSSESRHELGLVPANEVSKEGFDERWERVETMMNKREFAILRARADGLCWPEVATKLGGTPEAARKTLSRAMRRVRRTFLAGAASGGGGLLRYWRAGCVRPRMIALHADEESGG